MKVYASQQPLITGDERLYNAVREHLDWVLYALPAHSGRSWVDVGVYERAGFCRLFK